ncbi:MAG: hypothetical protein OZSIB_0500 [Candidatus Ozemobacter sibiricus]|uniref:DUF434 domain-containing protein n=1 Tax=Candidatus Ozemobacter sibiricus TaxID=2268124 RepID=A0A367ZMG4_9BACT|nr:MAG: hypothetical protein OZSIB_0500 [Candidatus Ozemobacter sibiricus]
MPGHRGPHPEDARLFAPTRLPVLRQAAADLAWLLTRGYGAEAALRLVGDHFQLTIRQRLAVGRSTCADQTAATRRQRCLALDACRGRGLAIDGYNILITLESALAGGYLFRGRDGAIRDLASLHGSWRRVAETARAVSLVADALAAIAGDDRASSASAPPPAHAGSGLGPVIWYLDAPVSNSGRLAALLRDTAAARRLDWTVELVMNTDRAVLATGLPVATSDSWILDHAPAWVNLVAAILPALDPSPPLIDLAIDG